MWCPNVTYVTAGNTEVKLDIYRRRGVTTPQPTVIHFHGGFWAAGTKEASQMYLIPWFEMGWNVVNVEYRLARVALAPAAVEDCLCALRFIAAQAKTYNVDVNRIVSMGESAGGHLALTTGMIPESSGLAHECEGAPLPKVAAIINWYGIADVADVIDEGPHKANLAVQWFGSLPNRDALARQLSPLNYIRADQPPVLTIHGDADTDGELPASCPAAGGFNQSGSAESADHDPRRQARKFFGGRTCQDLRRHSGVPQEEQSAYRAVTVRERFLFSAAFGSVRQAGSHRFDLVNLSAADLEDLAGLFDVPPFIDHIHAGHAFDLDVMHRASMLKHRKRINQSLLFIHQPSAAATAG